MLEIILVLINGEESIDESKAEGFSIEVIVNLCFVLTDSTFQVIRQCAILAFPKLYFQIFHVIRVKVSLKLVLLVFQTLQLRYSKGNDRLLIAVVEVINTTFFKVQVDFGLVSLISAVSVLCIGNVNIDLPNGEISD
jgi:hypothetical protein